MSCRRCASLVLAVMASACAASANTLHGQDQTAAAATRGSPTLIVRAELERAAGQTAWRAVQTLRGGGWSLKRYDRGRLARGEARSRPRHSLRVPRNSPIALEASPPRLSTMTPMSQMGRL